MSGIELTSSSLLKNVTRYEDIKKTASKGSQEMGKQDFLKLFTAQLKSQDPTDPVKNEAFVAQLAQFSSLEALTNMSSSIENFIKGQSANQMFNGSALIGKRIPVANAPGTLNEGGRIDAEVDLPQGASGITITVIDSQGREVTRMAAGAQQAGTMRFSWGGLDDAGNPVPPGNYSFQADAVIDGKNTKVPVSTMTTVQSVIVNPDNTVSLEVDGGKTILMSQVSRITG
jgi:flagellar basal-body rod modification protein FlgD